MLLGVLMRRDFLNEMHSWGIFGREGVWGAVIVRGAKRERRNSVPKDDTNALLLLSISNSIWFSVESKFECKLKCADPGSYCLDYTNAPKFY